MVKFASLYVVGENQESQQFGIIESLERVVLSCSLGAQLLKKPRIIAIINSKIPQMCRKYVCVKVKVTP
jgi:hypothetical protein